MGSENRADQLWDFLSSWLIGGGGGSALLVRPGDEYARITNNRAEGNVSLMNDSQILSAFQDLPGEAAQAEPPARVLVFDACHIGVILRAVLFVETVMSVGAMFGSTGATDWLLRVAVLSGAALPATLLWLIVACSLKKLLARLVPWVQQLFGMALGAVA